MIGLRKLRSNLPTSQSKCVEEVRSLTGLRGLAAILVVLFHYNVSALGNFFDHGYLWVDFFFILSGFVMALSYAELFEGTSNAYGTFIFRRLARVYPLYILMSLLAIPFLFHGHIFQFDAFFWQTLSANILMIQAWGIAPSLDDQAWSISAEWAAYLLFPVFLLITIFARRGLAWLVGAIATATIISISLAATPPQINSRVGVLDIGLFPNLLPLCLCISEFCLGLLTFRAASSTPIAMLARHPISGWLITFALGVAIVMSKSDLVVVALFPAFILTSAAETSFPARMFGHPVMHRLGLWSYSIYLVQIRFGQPRHRLEDKLLPHIGNLAYPVSVILCLGGVILSAMLLYQFVEVPSRQLIRKLGTRKGPLPALEASAP